MDDILDVIQQVINDGTANPNYVLGECAKIIEKNRGKIDSLRRKVALGDELAKHASRVHKQINTGERTVTLYAWMDLGQALHDIKEAKGDGDA